MKKQKVYLIPGYGESFKEVRYQKLADVVKKLGYSVVTVDPDWRAPLTKQTFRVEKDAIVIGFSLGSILAYLVVQQYPCCKAIFASMTPIHKYSEALWIQENSKHMSKDKAVACAKDIKTVKIDLNSLKTPYVVMAGEREGTKVMKADVLVPKNNHRMNAEYINAIAKVLS